MVIWKYILLLSFFEDIYKKWDVTKRYKNVLNSVIIDYFVHYQMFSQLFLIQMTSRQKKGYADYTVSGVITQLQII